MKKYGLLNTPETHLPSPLANETQRENEMELIYAIADYFDIPNEFIFIDSVRGDAVWFHTKAGAQYTCHLSRGKFLKKNSIRTA